MGTCKKNLNKIRPVVFELQSVKFWAHLTLLRPWGLTSQSQPGPNQAEQKSIEKGTRFKDNRNLALAVISDKVAKIGIFQTVIARVFMGRSGWYKYQQKA